MVIDISSVGACVRLEEAPPDATVLYLIIGNFAPIAAAPAWRKNLFLGVRFLREQPWVVESCSKRFDPAAWLKD